MGNKDRREHHFRKTLKAERNRRGWSQADLAKMLCDNGIQTYPTTIAKLEAAERSVRVDEVAAIADLFEMSVDRLLGRRKTPPKGDRLFVTRSLLETVQQTYWQVGQLEATLREQADELASVGGFGGLETASITAADALADARTELAAVVALSDSPAGGDAVKDGTRAMLRAMLDREDEDAK
jgi:transcriptional regulator with XRE-family HTH domain